MVGETIARICLIHFIEKEYSLPFFSRFNSLGCIHKNKKFQRKIAGSLFIGENVQQQTLKTIRCH